MGKGKIVGLGVLLGALGALAPMALIVWFAVAAALNKEEKELSRHASQVIQRAEQSIASTEKALMTLEQLPVLACSPQHIDAMRKFTINNPAIGEIRYMGPQGPRCTSWGNEASSSLEVQPDFRIGKHMQAYTYVASSVPGSELMLALQLGAYQALMNERRLIDVIIVDDDEVQLALSYESGHVMLLPDPANSRLAKALQGDTAVLEHDLLYARVSRNGWTALAVAAKPAMLNKVATEQRWLLPLGAGIGLYIVLIIIKLSRKRLSPEAELRLAIKHREFIVHYQPITEIRTGRCVGAEALVRWLRPDGSLVRPDLFIPLAEDTGLISAISDQVLRAVGKDLGPALRNDPTLHIALNLSPQDIEAERILPSIDHTIQEAGVQPHQIWLEVTERGLLNIGAARDTLERARALGYVAALDDFGTGYSSLQYLQGLPVDALKIDQSFVQTIGTGAASSTVIAHIIDMGRSLGLFLIAEGVETAEQADYLRHKGVDFAQGWFYAKAMPLQEFLTYYEDSLRNLQPIAPAMEAARKVG